MHLKLHPVTGPVIQSLQRTHYFRGKKWENSSQKYFSTAQLVRPVDLGIFFCYPNLLVA